MDKKFRGSQEKDPKSPENQENDFEGPEWEGLEQSGEELLQEERKKNHNPAIDLKKFKLEERKELKDLENKSMKGHEEYFVEESLPNSPKKPEGRQIMTRNRSLQ